MQLLSFFQIKFFHKKLSLLIIESNLLLRNVIAPIPHHFVEGPKNTKYLDLDGSFDLERDIVSGGFNLNNGVLQPLDSPGLGVKLL